MGMGPELFEPFEPPDPQVGLAVPFFPSSMSILLISDSISVLSSSLSFSHSSRGTPLGGVVGLGV